MKSLGESFGFEILLTVLLPGLAVFIGLLAVEPNLQRSMRSSFPAVVAFLPGDDHAPNGVAKSDDTPSSNAEAGNAKPADANSSTKAASRPEKNDREWLQIFALMAVISLLGASVAALNGFFETVFYDNVTPHLLGIDSRTFLAHWDEYLHRLGKESNTYVDRIVVWFLFESRMAVAIGIVVAIGLWFGEIPSAMVFYLGIAFIAFAVVAIMHHYELGKYRLDRSGDWQALRSAEVAVAERQAADASSARSIAARLGDVEQQVRRLRRRIRCRRRQAINAGI